MSNTTNLVLPLIEAAQAQKHITHNEALTTLDAVVQLSASARDMTGPRLVWDLSRIISWLTKPRAGGPLTASVSATG